MTDKEAINILEEYRKDFCKLGTEHYEAITHAIEKLRESGCPGCKKLDKLNKEILTELQYLSVTTPQLYSDEKIRWVWYDSIDRFRKVLMQRIKKLIDETCNGTGKNPEQSCDKCGTRLIDNCPNCGAPQCCPKCCREVTDELRKQIKKPEQPEVDRLAFKVYMILSEHKRFDCPCEDCECYWDKAREIATALATPKVRVPEKSDLIKLAEKCCKFYPCELVMDEATACSRCFSCKTGSTILATIYEVLRMNGESK